MPRKFYKYILVAYFALLFIACSVFTPKPAASAADIEKEEQAVYSFFVGSKGPVLILKQTALGSPDNDPQQAMDFAWDGLPGISRDTIQNFIDRNAQPGDLSPDMNLGVEYILLGEEELASITRQQNWGEVLAQKYPGAQGYTMFSRVGFNRTLDQAVIYVGNLAGPLMGSGYYYLLDKENGVWVLKQQVMAWIS